MVVGFGVVLQSIRVVVGQSQMVAVVVLALSILVVGVLSILAADLASEVEALQNPHAFVVDQVGRWEVVPCCQNQAYLGEVAIHHPLPLVEVCECGLEL